MERCQAARSFVEDFEFQVGASLYLFIFNRHLRELSGVVPDADVGGHHGERVRSLVRPMAAAVLRVPWREGGVHR